MLLIPVHFATAGELELEIMAENGPSEVEEGESWLMMQIVEHLVDASCKDAKKSSGQEEETHQSQVWKMEQLEHQEYVHSEKE